MPRLHQKNANSNDRVQETSLILPDPDSRDIRTRCGMVIFGLEKALGKLVLDLAEDISDLPKSQVTPILNRWRAGQAAAEDEISESPLSIVVQESHLSEIIDLAAEVTAEEIRNEYVNRIRELANALQIYTVRNATAHANRPFPQSYWHRTATLATDPAIDQLQFYGVIDAFEAAIHGSLERPPDDWIQKTRWTIPNNLPEPFDHDDTGLHGRKNEKKELLKYLRKDRVSMAAVTAKGGLGKTALVLEVLRDLAVSDTAPDWFDRIVYLSAKTEELTASGIEKLASPATSIEEARERLFDELREGEETIEEIIDRLGDRRVLVCLDNLETVLTNAQHEKEPGDEFRKFHLNLPASWTLLVTSRVSVEGANFVRALERLPKEGAIKMARIYMREQGLVGDSFSQDDVEKMVDATDRNPLAIRLVIDSIGAGSNLSAAINNTKQDVVRYSYRNLIDQLSGVARELLECLFISREPINRFDAASLIDRDSSEVADGLRQLMRTSLCTRRSEGGEERYELSASVRELLLEQPVDLSTRTQVRDRQIQFRETENYQQKKQQEKKTSRLSVFHVSDDVSPSVRYLIRESHDVIRSSPFDQRKAVQTINRLEGAAQDNPNNLELPLPND